MTNPLPPACSDVHILSHATELWSDSHNTSCKGYRRNERLSPAHPYHPFQPKLIALGCKWRTFSAFTYGQHTLYVEHACEVIYQLNPLSVTSGILNNQLSEP